MSVPTGIGNYPPGVTDNDPHFESEECQHKELQGGYCEDCGELIDENAAAEAAYERRPGLKAKEEIVSTLARSFKGARELRTLEKTP